MSHEPRARREMATRMELRERVTRALEEALAQHGIAFDPVDDTAGVGATMADLLSQQEQEPEPDFVVERDSVGWLAHRDAAEAVTLYPPPVGAYQAWLHNKGDARERFVPVHLNAAPARQPEDDALHIVESLLESWERNGKPDRVEITPMGLSAIREALAAAPAERERDTGQRLRSALHELHAMVRGECPGLLDEDRGGDSRLALEIEELLTPTQQEQP